MRRGRDSARALASRVAGKLAATVLTLTALAAVATAGDAVPVADSTSLRFELGAGSDYTNELFYEDAFVDTVALGRRLVGSPQARFAGVALLALAGTRNLGSTTWSLANDLSLGDEIRRDALAGSWRGELGPDWVLFAAPRLEYRRDRSFVAALDGGRAGRLRAGDAYLRGALSRQPGLQQRGHPEPT